MSETMKADRPHHPWLEYLPEGGDRVKSTQLDKDTFTIGRSDAADVQIDSTRVSREHARILRKNGKYFIRDLESTNGTFVNGQRIEEIELSAGDVIVVADTEFSFLMDSVSRLRRMKTQQMPSTSPAVSGDRTDAGNRHTRDAVLALRSTHEQLCQRFIQLDLTSIRELPAAIPFAHLEDFTNAGGILARKFSPMLQPPSHALIRLREAHRLETVNRCQNIPQCSRIIVPVEPWEIHEIGTLIWHFEAMAASLPRTITLLASVRASDAADLTEVQSFCNDLENIGVAICCHDFVGSHVHIDNLADLQPQLIMLSEEMSANLEGKPQNHDRLVSVVEACEKLDIRPVVTGKVYQELIDDVSSFGINLFLPIAETLNSDSFSTELPHEALAETACL